jgi:hypothetical protein
MCRRPPRIPVRTAAGLVLIVLAACGDQRLDDFSAPSRDELQQVLVGGAATRLDAQGRFSLSTTAGAGELSQAQARELATAYINVAGPSFSRRLTKDRGSLVDVKSLRQCGDPLYATTPFQQMASDVPTDLQRKYGSWWLVGFCGRGGTTEVSVAVSALATGLSVENGQIRFGTSDGNEFFTLGVPAEWDSPVGLSPERAVMRVSHRTGRRVSDAPRLIAADPRVAYPQGAVWRVGLESSVRFHTTKTQRVIQETVLYAGIHQDVGKLPRKVADDAFILRVPMGTQPSEVTFSYSYFEDGTKLTSRLVQRTTSIRRREDVPIVLETALPEEP